MRRNTGLNRLSISQAQTSIEAGNVIAYPTEAVYGLGCDPWNECAVHQVLALKHRPVEKGLILVIADWAQLFPLIQPLTEAQLLAVRQTWPGHVTWVFPKSEQVPSWVSGAFDTIAIRMSAHPVTRALALKQPLISTSANQSGLEPARSWDEVLAQFPEGIEGCVEGVLGGALQPSTIRDVLTGACLR